MKSLIEEDIYVFNLEIALTAQQIIITVINILNKLLTYSLGYDDRIMIKIASLAV